MLGGKGIFVPGVEISHSSQQQISKAWQNIAWCYQSSFDLRRWHMAPANISRLSQVHTTWASKTVLCGKYNNNLKLKKIFLQEGGILFKQCFKPNARKPTRLEDKKQWDDVNWKCYWLLGSLQEKGPLGCSTMWVVMAGASSSTEPMIPTAILPLKLPVWLDQNLLKSMVSFCWIQRDLDQDFPPFVILPLL